VEFAKWKRFSAMGLIAESSDNDWKLLQIEAPRRILMATDKQIAANRRNAQFSILLTQPFLSAKIGPSKRTSLGQAGAPALLVRKLQTSDSFSFM